MRISQLEYIIAVEKYGSINMAANQMFVSQSLLSSAIKGLEEELGQPLFLRSNKGIKLTSFGKEFLPYARSVVTQINQMKSLGKQNLPSAHSLNICTNGFRFSFELAAQLYSSYSHGFADIHITDCSRQEAIDMLSNHTAEVGIARVWSFQANTMSKQMMSKNVVFYPCTVKPTAVIVGHNSPLFVHSKTTVAAEELSDYPYLICDYAQYNPSKKILDQIPGLHPKRFMFTSNLGAAMEVLKYSNAYMITADSTNPERQLGDYSEYRVLEIEDCSHYGQIGWMKNRHSDLSPLAQEYVELVSYYLQNR